MSPDRPPLGDDDLTALVDGRLPPDRTAAVEARLAERPDLGARVAAERRDRDALRERLAAIAAEPIPSRLRVATVLATRRQRQRRVFGAVAALIAVFAIGAATGSVATRQLAGTAAPALPVYAAVAGEAVAAHRTFVVEVAHPVEVDVGREAHLLGWLSKRLGRPIVAPALDRFGYRLIGGRLLPVETGPAETGAAAQLMYEDDGGRRLTLWVQAAEGEATAFRFHREATTSTFVWIDQGWGFAVTAPTDRDGLLPIAEAVYHDIEAAAGRAG